MVEDEAIQETLERHLDDLDAAVKTLIRQALKGGGEDNITVLCFEIVEGEADTTRIDAGEMEERTRENVFEEPDDDTLDELDRVPAIDDTMLVRPEDLPAEAAPRRRRRERHERSVPIFPALLLVGIVIALIVFAVLSLFR